MTPENGAAGEYQSPAREDTAAEAKRSTAGRRPARGTTSVVSVYEWLLADCSRRAGGR